MSYPGEPVYPQVFLQREAGESGRAKQACGAAEGLQDVHAGGLGGGGGRRGTQTPLEAAKPHALQKGPASPAKTLT